jgi:hypothetical protein
VRCRVVLDLMRATILLFLLCSAASADSISLTASATAVEGVDDSVYDSVTGIFTADYFTTILYPGTPYQYAVQEVYISVPNFGLGGASGCVETPPGNMTSCVFGVDAGFSLQGSGSNGDIVEGGFGGDNQGYDSGGCFGGCAAYLPLGVYTLTVFASAVADGVDETTFDLETVNIVSAVPEPATWFTGALSLVFLYTVGAPRLRRRLTASY